MESYSVHVVIHLCVNRFSFSSLSVLISNEPYKWILKKITTIKNNVVCHLFVRH